MNKDYKMIKETSQKLDFSNSNANPFGAIETNKNHTSKIESQKSNNYRKSDQHNNESYESKIIIPKKSNNRKSEDSDGSSFLSNFDELKPQTKNQANKEQKIDDHFLDEGISEFNMDMDKRYFTGENQAAMLQFIHAIS